MNIIVKKAETQEEIDAIHKLWYEVFCEEKKMRDPKNFPEKKDIDEYIPCSVYFMALENNELIGAMRLVSHNCTGKFLMEKGFELPEFVTKQREKAIEVSRAVIRGDKRGDKNHFVLFSLLKVIYEYAKDNNYIYLCAFIIPAVLDMLLKFGWRFKWIGKSSKMYNVLFTPTVLEIKDENVKGISK